MNIATNLLKGWNEERGMWVYGSLVVEAIQNKKNYYIADLDVRVDIEDDASAFLQGLYKVDPVSVSQFTGFFDDTGWDTLTVEDKEVYKWLYDTLGLQLWRGQLIFGGDILDGVDAFDEQIRGKVYWNINGWYVGGNFNNYLNEIILPHYVVGNSYNKF